MLESDVGDLSFIYSCGYFAQVSVLLYTWVKNNLIHRKISSILKTSLIKPMTSELLCTIKKNYTKCNKVQEGRGLIFQRLLFWNKDGQIY